jgi:hypothetical protein
VSSPPNPIKVSLVASPTNVSLPEEPVKVSMIKPHQNQFQIAELPAAKYVSAPPTEHCSCEKVRSMKHLKICNSDDIQYENRDRSLW